MPMASDLSLVCDENFFTVGSTVKRAGLEGYEEVGEGVDVFLGPSSIAEVLEVACFGVRHLRPGEVNVLNDVFGGSYCRNGV